MGMIDPLFKLNSLDITNFQTVKFLKKRVDRFCDSILHYAGSKSKFKFKALENGIRDQAIYVRQWLSH